jgi:hypothetical protein
MTAWNVLYYAHIVKLMAIQLDVCKFKSEHGVTFQKTWIFRIYIH